MPTTSFPLNFVLQQLMDGHCSLWVVKIKIYWPKFFFTTRCKSIPCPHPLKVFITTHDEDQPSKSVTCETTFMNWCHNTRTRLLVNCWVSVGKKFSSQTGWTARKRNPICPLEKPNCASWSMRRFFGRLKGRYLWQTRTAAWQTDRDGQHPSSTARSRRERQKVYL